MEIRTLIQDLRPGRRWLALAVAVALIAGVATPPLAQAASVSFWTMPANVQEIALDSADNLWIQTEGVSGLHKLASNDMLTTYTTPAVVHARTIATDGDTPNKVWSPGTITGVEGAVQVISRLDPVSLEVTSWPAGLTAVRVVAGTDDKVWFSNATNTIARLEPGTDTVTSWALPFNINLGGLDVTNRPWFSYNIGGEWGLARLDPGLNQLTNWPVAMSPDNVQRPVVDDAGNLWAALRHSAGEDSIIRLEPADDMITEWTCRPGCDQLVHVAADAAGNVWFTEDFFANARFSYIGRLAPVAPPTFTEWQLHCENLGGGNNCVNGWAPRTPLVDSDGKIWMRIFDYDAPNPFPTNKIARLTP